LRVELFDVLLRLRYLLVGEEGEVLLQLGRVVTALAGVVGLGGGVRKGCRLRIVSIHLMSDKDVKALT
jgi:hypothetical protein